MTVLFVYKGEGPTRRNSVIDAQLNSLASHNIEVFKFPLTTKGVLSYFSAYKQLRRYLRDHSIDLIHAHYSYSGFVAGLTFKKTVCSLMGSDVFDQPSFIKLVTRFFYRFIWKKTIVKSLQMQAVYPKSTLIPNGVDFDIFKPMDRKVALSVTHFRPDKKHIIFVAENPNETVKNLPLAKEAISLLSDEVVFHPISKKNQQELTYYYNSADLLLLTSKTEGSPNVVKEAMACNCPVVSTDVGDVKMRIGNTEGCYIALQDPQDIANKIEMALRTEKRTIGRQNIASINSENIAKELIKVYKTT